MELVWVWWWVRLHILGSIPENHPRALTITSQLSSPSKRKPLHALKRMGRDSKRHPCKGFRWVYVLAVDLDAHAPRTMGPSFFVLSPLDICGVQIALRNLGGSILLHFTLSTLLDWVGLGFSWVLIQNQKGHEKRWGRQPAARAGSLCFTYLLFGWTHGLYHERLVLVRCGPPFFIVDMVVHLHRKKNQQCAMNPDRQLLFLWWAFA